MVNKDNNVAVSLWKKTETETMTREITFLRPIRGMPATRATKTQRYTRFPDASGGVLTTSTRLHDIPGSDTFTVDETMSISKANQGDEDSDACVDVKISYDIAWKKNNYLMKGLIESNTHSAMRGWQRAYVEHLARHAESSTSSVAVAAKRSWSRGRKPSLKASLVSFLPPFNVSMAKRPGFNPSWREL